jgi:hypothetical protein
VFCLNKVLFLTFSGNLVLTHCPICQVEHQTLIDSIICNNPRYQTNPSNACNIERAAKFDFLFKQNFIHFFLIVFQTMATNGLLKLKFCPFIGFPDQNLKNFSILKSAK